MENQPLVSVIIPVYNVEKYLRECIDSVINQTYKNLEIILVDDGSTDSSGKICDEYVEKDERITAIHQKNGGLSQARNRGLEESTGEYIYFLDSDDYISLDAIEKLYAIAETQKPDFVFFDAISFEDSSKGFDIEQRYKRNKIYNVNSGPNTLSVMQKNKEYHSAVYLMFFDKTFIESSSLRFVPNILYEDLVFTYQAYCKAEKVAQCCEALYFRRYRPNSIMTSQKSQKNFFSMHQVFKEIVLCSSDIANEPFAEEYISRCAFNVFNIYENLNFKDKKICRKEIADFKKSVLENNAFGNTALKMRCFGKVFWFIYKIYEKTVGRLLKGKK